MRLLNELPVYYKDEKRYIRLYEGDLTKPGEATDVDLIVVSAWEGNYEPLDKTLIGALNENGLVVKNLSEDKEEDLREAFNSWISKPLPPSDSLPSYKRLLCFEPPDEKRPVEFIGDIFQGLMPFVGNPEYATDSVAMPLVASGVRGAPPVGILEAILEAAVQWMAHGMPIHKLNIVEINAEKAALVNGAFEILKRKYSRFSKPKRRFKYDLFVSYSHDDTKIVLPIIQALENERPEMEIFLDRQDLNAGSVWQQSLYDALDNCERVLAFYSPTYLSSKVCKEEFNIAVFRHRETPEGVLVPIYLLNAALPTYMKLIQFIDARTHIPDEPKKVANEILKAMDFS